MDQKQIKKISFKIIKAIAFITLSFLIFLLTWKVGEIVVFTKKGGNFQKFSPIAFQLNPICKDRYINIETDKNRFFSVIKFEDYKQIDKKCLIKLDISSENILNIDKKFRKLKIAEFISLQYFKKSKTYKVYKNQNDYVNISWYKIENGTPKIIKYRYYFTPFIIPMFFLFSIFLTFFIFKFFKKFFLKFGDTSEPKN